MQEPFRAYLQFALQLHATAELLLQVPKSGVF